MCTGWHRRVTAILVRGELWGVSSEWFVSYNVLAGAVQHSARSVGGCSGLFWFLQPLSQPQPQLSPWWWGTEMLETNKCASEPSPSLGLNSPAPCRTTCSLLGKVWPRAVGELRCPTLACTSLGSLERNHLDIKQNWIRVKWIFLTYTNLKKIQYIIYFHNELRNATRSQKSGVEWIPSRIIIIQRIILGHKIGCGDSSVLINHWGHQQCSCTLSRPIPGHAWNKNTGTDSCGFTALKVLQRIRRDQQNFKYWRSFSWCSGRSCISYCGNKSTDCSVNQISLTFRIQN